MQYRSQGTITLTQITVILTSEQALDLAKELMTAGGNKTPNNTVRLMVDTGGNVAATAWADA